MSDYKFCKECKCFHYTDRECPPIYSVFNPDYSDKTPVHANSHYDAALKYAEDYNVNSDYCLMSETVEITVEKDGVKKVFKISAEPSVDYSANEVE